VQNAPTSQADWLWDCTTPDVALTGSSVPVSAIRFLRKSAAPGPFFLQIKSAFRTDPTWKGHGLQPCRMPVRSNRPSGPEGEFPRRLKPSAFRCFYGAPEGAPLQSLDGTCGGVRVQSVEAADIRRMLAARPKSAAGSHSKSLIAKRQPSTPRSYSQFFQERRSSAAPARPGRC
jgi:hypothetical protein